MRQLEFQRVIRRQDLQENPTKYYLFGDNVQRVGNGGQAAQMRGEPNAVGIPTKWAPRRDESSYFSKSKDDWPHIKQIIDDAFASIPDNVTVVVPVNGIGTGLAELVQRWPEVLVYIEYKIKELGCQ